MCGVFTAWPSTLMFEMKYDEIWKVALYIWSVYETICIHFRIYFLVQHLNNLRGQLKYSWLADLQCPHILLTFIYVWRTLSSTWCGVIPHLIPIPVNPSPSYPLGAVRAPISMTLLCTENHDWFQMMFKSAKQGIRRRCSGLGGDIFYSHRHLHKTKPEYELGLEMFELWCRAHTDQSPYLHLHSHPQPQTLIKKTDSMKTYYN